MPNGRPLGSPRPPKSPQNPQKSSKKCLRVGSLALSSKNMKNHRCSGTSDPSFCGSRTSGSMIFTFAAGPPKGTQKTSPNHNFCHLLGLLGAKVPLFGYPDGCLKFHDFSDGSRYSFCFQNELTLRRQRINFWSLFGTFFLLSSRGCL